jgi:hypothetical protein
MKITTQLRFMLVFVDLFRISCVGMLVFLAYLSMNETAMKKFGIVVLEILKSVGT